MIRAVFYDCAVTALERRVSVAPGVALHVEWRRGNPEAAPFVLVHGLASNLRLWDGVAAQLHALGHTVVALDQRGHGLSDAPEAGYDLDTAVADLLAVIHALGLTTGARRTILGRQRRPGAGLAPTGRACAASPASTAGSASWPSGIPRGTPASPR